MNTGPHGRIKQHQRHVKRQRSPVQIKWNKAFTTSANAWKKLEPEFKTLWSAIAVGNETAYNTFMKVNMTRAFNGLRLIASPPLDV